MSSGEKAALFTLVSLGLVASAMAAYISYRVASGLQGVSNAASEAGGILNTVKSLI